MSLPVIQADLETRLGVGEVGRYSRATDGNITAAISQAWDKFRSAALNVWTALSVDALTAATLPNEARSHIVSDALDILSSGQVRPDDIQKKADEAAAWRGWLIGDKVRSFDGILVETGASTGGASARIAAPDGHVFDRDNQNSRFNSVFRPI